MAGLRELKRERSRQHISDVATRLFLARGFDAVTVAEVAAAAEVSKMTVFNHFPRKEDLLLDREPEIRALMTATVHGRPAGTTALKALRAFTLDLAEQRHTLSGLTDAATPFLRTVAASPALLTRVREITGELETALAALLGEDETVTDPRLLAALTIAAYRTVYAVTCGLLLGGQPAAGLVDDHTGRVHAAFDALEAAARTGRAASTGEHPLPVTAAGARAVRRP